MKKVKFIGLSLISFVLGVNNVLAQCFVNNKEVPCDQMMGEVGIFFFIFMALFFIAMFALFIFWVMMLIHAIKYQTENKIVWILVLLFTSGLGAIIYYFMEKRPMDKAKKLEGQNNIS